MSSCAELGRLPDVAGAATVAVPGVGVTLGGYLVRPVNRQRAAPAVLLLPDLGGSAEDVLDEARALAERGYVALALSMRGAAGSQGVDACGADETVDAIEALQWLSRQPDVDPSRLGIVGYGQGAQVALLAASRSAMLKAVVVFNPITDPQHLRASTASAALRKHLTQDCASVATAAVSPLAQAAGIIAPVLFIHGGKDRRVPPSQSEMLDERLRAENKMTELHVLPEAGHEFTAEQTSKAWSWVASFLGSHQLRAAASRTSDQQARVNKFAERGWNLPVTRHVDSLQAIGKVKRQRVSTMENPHVPGRRDEIRELWFDGLYMQVLIPGRKRDFLLQEIAISASRYKVLYGLRVGAQRQAVEELLGQPDVHGDDYLEYMNASGVGSARIYLKDNRVAKIEWEYRAD